MNRVSPSNEPIRIQTNRKPQNQRESQALLTLNRLANRNPIEVDNPFGLLRPQSELISHVENWLESTREMGAEDGRMFVWLNASYGGGKTQSIGRFQSTVLNASSDSENYKIAMTSVNLKKSSAKNGATALQIALFEQAMVTGTSQVKATIDKEVDRLMKNTAIPEGIFHSLGIGLDLLAVLFGVPAIGAGTLGGWTLQNILNKWTYRDANLRAKLKELGLDGNDCTDLMLKWMRVLLSPSEKTVKQFQACYRNLAREKRLFSVFRRCLEKLGYGTLIIVTDEAQMLEPNLTTAYESLADPELEELDPNYSQLNLGFIFATTDYGRFADETKFRGFPTRFILPAKVINLKQPQISDDVDDFMFTRNAIENLLKEQPFLNPKHPTPQESKKAKAKIKQAAENESLTWGMLWQEVLKLYF